MKKLLIAALLICFSLPAVQAQTLLFQGEFEVPAAIASTQDVQGNLYLANQQGQIYQYNPKGVKLNTFSPDELLYISSMQALPGLQLLLFDKNRQSLYWIDRFLTQTGEYALGDDRTSGLIDAVAAAEGNGMWIVDGSQQRLLKRQFPGGDVLLSVPLNLVTQSKQLKITYMREHKGKVYLFSPEDGMLVFDTMGNYEQTLELPRLQTLWLDEGRIYFTQKNVLGFLDLNTKALVRIPILDTAVEHLLVKDRHVWLLAQGKAVHYLLMPGTAAGQTKN